MEGVERYKVRLVPHHEKWVDEYQQAESRIRAVWGGNVIDVQHVGSTTVRDIPAKPILDIAVRLHSIRNMDTAALLRLGYDYCGPRCDRGTHHLYVLRGANQISLRHVHRYDAGDDQCFQLIGFRDYLGAHPDVAQRYAELKEAPASRYPEDRVAYTKGREDFVQSIYALLDRQRRPL